MTTEKYRIHKLLPKKAVSARRQCRKTNNVLVKGTRRVSESDETLFRLPSTNAFWELFLSHLAYADALLNAALWLREMVRNHSPWISQRELFPPLQSGMAPHGCSTLGTCREYPWSKNCQGNFVLDRAQRGAFLHMLLITDRDISSLTGWAAL